MESHAEHYATFEKITIEIIDDIQSSTVFGRLITQDKVDAINNLLRLIRGQIVNFGAEHPKTLLSLDDLAERYMDIYMYENAEKILCRMLHGRRRTWGQRDVRVPQALAQLGHSVCNQRKFQLAEMYYYDAMIEFGYHYKGDHPEIMRVVDGLAYTYYSLLDLPRSETMYKRVLTFYDKTLGRENPTTLAAVTKLAKVYQDLKKFDAAEELCAASLDACVKVLGSEHPTTQSAVIILAQLKHEQGQSVQAETMYRMAWQCNKGTLGEHHKDTLSIVVLIAQLLCDQDKQREAEEMFQRALSGYEETLGLAHPTTLEVMFNVGSTLFKQGRVDEALQVLQTSYDGRLQYFGDRHPSSLLNLLELGKVYHQQSLWRHKSTAGEKRLLAESTLRRAAEGLDQVMGSEDKQAMGATQYFAEFLLGEGREREAEDLFQRIFSYSKKRYGSCSLRTAEAAYRLGSILALRSAHALAAKAFLQAYESYMECMEREEQEREEAEEEKEEEENVRRMLADLRGSAESISEEHSFEDCDDYNYEEVGNEGKEEEKVEKKKEKSGRQAEASAVAAAVRVSDRKNLIDGINIGIGYRKETENNNNNNNHHNRSSNKNKYKKEKRSVEYQPEDRSFDLEAVVAASLRKLERKANAATAAVRDASSTTADNLDARLYAAEDTRQGPKEAKPGGKQQEERANRDDRKEREDRQGEIMSARKEKERDRGADRWRGEEERSGSNNGKYASRNETGQERNQIVRRSVEMKGMGKGTRKGMGKGIHHNPAVTKSISRSISSHFISSAAASNCTSSTTTNINNTKSKSHELPLNDAFAVRKAELISLANEAHQQFQHSTMLSDL